MLNPDFIQDLHALLLTITSSLPSWITVQWCAYQLPGSMSNSSSDLLLYKSSCLDVMNTLQHAVRVWNIIEFGCTTVNGCYVMQQTSNNCVQLLLTPHLPAPVWCDPCMLGPWGWFGRRPWAYMLRDQHVTCRIVTVLVKVTKSKAIHNRTWHKLTAHAALIWHGTCILYNHISWQQNSCSM